MAYWVFLGREAHVDELEQGLSQADVIKKIVD